MVARRREDNKHYKVACGQSGNPRPGVKKRREKRFVADVNQGTQLDGVQERLDLLFFKERGVRGLSLQTGCFGSRCRVGLDGALFEQMIEQDPNRGQVLPLGRNATGMSCQPVSDMVRFDLSKLQFVL